MVKRGEASDYLEAIKTCLWTSNWAKWISFP
jgi:hypothetical protein